MTITELEEQAKPFEKVEKYLDMCRMLAVGPMVQREGGVPNRVILRKLDGTQPYVVHWQLFDEKTGKHSGFSDGFYTSDYDDALVEFTRRIKQNILT